jgi:hypothetical protein
MKSNRNSNWSEIEADWRAGQISGREIAHNHGISETTLPRQAVARGWLRDLAGDVAAETKHLLMLDAAQSTHPAHHLHACDDSAEIIERAALKGADVVRSHRVDVKFAKDIVMDLFRELAAITANHAAMTADIMELTKNDTDGGKRRAELLKNIGLSVRAAGARDLAGALKHLTMLERQAWNLDAENEAVKPVVNFGVLTGLYLKPKEKTIN